MEREVLKIKYVGRDGLEHSFNDIEIREYTYTANRMGSSQITATLDYERCLDDDWHIGRDFVTFNGENFYIQEIPSSSKDNKDVRYSHEITFRSEREVLNTTYFYDVVPDYASTANKPCTNSSTFSFYGTLNEFINRLNCALKKADVADSNIDDLIKGDILKFTPAGDGFYAIFDEDGGYLSDADESVELSFEDSYIWDAIETAYDSYEIPYEFHGRAIIFGKTPTIVDHSFKYGEENELLSVTKTNANAKIVRKVTFKGSSENIPYYYPNKSEYGDYKIQVDTAGKDIKISPEDFTVVNQQKLFSVISQKLKVTIKHQGNANLEVSNFRLMNPSETTNDGIKWTDSSNVQAGTDSNKQPFYVAPVYYFDFVPPSSSEDYGTLSLGDLDFKLCVTNGMPETPTDTWHWESVKKIELGRVVNGVPIFSHETDGSGIDHYQVLEQNANHTAFYEGMTFPKDLIEGTWAIKLHIEIPNNLKKNDKRLYQGWVGVTDFWVNLTIYHDNYYFETEDGTICQSANFTKWCGLNFSKDFVRSFIGQSFYWEAGEMMPSQEYLQPPKYRESFGDERFYKALNDPSASTDSYVHEDDYKDPDTGKLYEFKNEWEKGFNDEYIYVNDDIKPTIEGITNSQDVLFGSIAGVAFDSDDNDELKADADEDSDTSTLSYKHSYFYLKLNKFDGADGFDLFASASQSGSMTIQMTSGNCAGCSFVIQAYEVTDAVNGKLSYKNPVQVDEDGNIVAGTFADKVKKGSYQDEQQNTEENEIWICVQKDAETFGVIMPNQTNEYFPNIGDTFNIINIDLPESYILAAERKGMQEAIRYMSENNEDRFTFEISCSRIFFQENPHVLAQISENSMIPVEYNGVTHNLYVSTFTFTVKEKEALPEVTMDLEDEIAVGDTFEKKVTERLQSVIGSPANVQNMVSGVSVGNNTIIKTGDTTTPTNNNVFSAEKSDERFLRKDIDDTTDKTITVGGLSSTGDVTVGQYMPGYSSYGARITQGGEIEAQSLKVWGSIEAPYLKFNRVSVMAGVRFQTFGGGEIESVTIDTDDDGNELATGTITIKTERGEVGSVDVDDLCVGIFHSFYGENETETIDTKDGNFVFAGFRTSYFRVTEILDDTYTTFRYVLRGVSDDWTTQYHPQQYMSFSCYANTNNTDRQKCKVETNQYELLLKDMSTWTFGENNIYAIFGVLEGFSLSGKQFHGTGVVLGNFYYYGTQNFFVNAPLSIEIDTDGDYFLSYGESMNVKCKVTQNGYDVTDRVTKWDIVRETGNATEDAAWKAKDKVKNFQGEIQICLTDEENDLADNGNTISTLFTITATMDDSEQIQASLEI